MLSDDVVTVGQYFIDRAAYVDLKQKLVAAGTRLMGGLSKLIERLPMIFGIGKTTLT